MVWCQITGANWGPALRVPRWVGAVLRAQTDLVLVDGLPDFLGVAGRPVVVEAAKVDVDFIQVALLEVEGRK